MKKAFTMIELVFVIVVIGILAAVIIPSTKTNPAQEAAVQLLSHIRYTQHLAMIDDKYDAANANWFQNRWQIRFTGDTYSIVSDNNTNFAVNPSNSAANLQNIDLNDDYSVAVSYNAGSSCPGPNSIISFDHLGRPLIGVLTTNYGQLMTTPCQITLTSGAETVNIDINSETGYASIAF